MRATIVFIVFLGISTAIACPQGASAPRVVKVYVQGDSSRLADFVEECEREFPNHGMKFQVVPFNSEFQYNIVVAQESSMAGAAASVIALDNKGIFVASVVRSGRWTGKGAFNAVAKEFARKLAVLSPQ